MICADHLRGFVVGKRDGRSLGIWRLARRGAVQSKLRYDLPEDFVYYVESGPARDTPSFYEGKVRAAPLDERTLPLVP